MMGDNELKSGMAGKAGLAHQWNSPQQMDIYSALMFLSSEFQRFEQERTQWKQESALLQVQNTPTNKTMNISMIIIISHLLNIITTTFTLLKHDV
jgi:hypothetical protein